MKNIQARPFRDAQDDGAAALCDICAGEIYGGDLAHLIDGFAVCPECFFDFTFDYFSHCLMTGREIKEANSYEND